MPVIVITGIMASGKSTVAQLVAERLPKSAHVRGDVFRRMVVSGRAEPTSDMAPEEVDQLRLRHGLAALVADRYAEAGFTAVLQDIFVEEDLSRLVGAVRARPLYVVVLVPRPDVVAAREDGRGKTGYGEHWTVAGMDRALRERTPRIGLWLDSSDQSPDETAGEVLARLEEARVGNT